MPEPGNKQRGRPAEDFIFRGASRRVGAQTEKRDENGSALDKTSKLSSPFEHFGGKIFIFFFE